MGHPYTNYITYNLYQKKPTDPASGQKKKNNGTQGLEARRIVGVLRPLRTPLNSGQFVLYYNIGRWADLPPIVLYCHMKQIFNIV